MTSPTIIAEPRGPSGPYSYKDLRSYLHALEALGDLRRVHRTVSADLEAAAFTRLSYERQSPAPLFENVRGVAPGFRLLGAPAGLSAAPGKPLARVALSVGLPAETTAAELVEHLARARDAVPVPPRTVGRADAACKQNVLLGDDATLDRFPVPRVHEFDGGRYPNTWGIIVARTPDGRWTNWSIARIMMVDGKHMTGLVIPAQHIGMIWQEWVERGEPMPYALVQGGDPAVPFVGGIPLPPGTDEAGYIGALYGEPVEVVPCETVDLEVPASAEIVIEGHLSIGRDAEEGPFGEFAGYASTRTSMQPVYSVEAITHRDDPIWPIVAEGRPVDEFHTVTGVGQAAEVLAELRAAGLPVTTAWSPLRAAAHWMVVTVPQDWRERLPGVDSAEFTHRIGEVLSESHSGRATAATFVLDDDIDPADDTDLLWALATRIHPLEKAEAWPGFVHPLLNCYTPQERAAQYGPIVFHDGLQPVPDGSRLPHCSFAQAYPEHVRRLVLDHWDD
ncbi:bagremycin/ferroverdin biosynthesis UbiD family decarboxylase BagN/FevL [Streptomyces aureocirculatus]|uniref:bagremycin/ferroverdin biosynthesis UbiD family decarboxylase BagN/FevL n=1 Tax=Streptomyces aureocirculatus TaxID=67275 RepID=UPI0006906553|nr:bagremycin/ferroverdin biosynthesis UbiD family decarboxylase BagN/FevL [Streptomyces aureocirculatus]